MCLVHSIIIRQSYYILYITFAFYLLLPLFTSLSPRGTVFISPSLPDTLYTLLTEHPPLSTPGMFPVCTVCTVPCALLMMLRPRAVHPPWLLLPGVPPGTTRRSG